MDVEIEVTAQKEQIKTLFDRVAKVENEQKTIRDLTRTVDRLAVGVETMAKELAEQSKRLEALENKPVETATYIKRQIISVIISVVVGGALGALLALILR